MFDPSKIQSHTHDFNPKTPTGEVLKDVTITVRASSHPKAREVDKALELEEDNRAKMLVRKGQKATDPKTEEDQSWEESVRYRRLASRVEQFKGMELEGKAIDKDIALITKALQEHDWIAMEVLKESTEQVNFFSGRGKASA